MHTPLSPTSYTTELDAVNIILQTIGAAPINTLQGVQNEDVHIARNILRQITEELQASEWHFNTEENYPFHPDSEGHIALPPNVTRIHPYNRNLDITMRGRYIYDRGRHTYTFDRGFDAYIVHTLPFEECPPTARIYITIKAARRFQKLTLGDSAIEEWTREDEFAARAAFEAANLRQTDARLGIRYKNDPVISEDLNPWRS